MDNYGFNIEESNRLNVTYLGESILAKNEQGRLKSHIMTIFPNEEVEKGKKGVVITEPSTLHVDQCVEYLDYLNSLRADMNIPPLTEEEKNEKLGEAVALTIIEEADGQVYAVIRPDPKKMDLAYDADKILQKILPKFRIFFMHTDDKQIREAIRERGESWRMQSLPQSTEDMQRTVADRKIALNLKQRIIYYYNIQTGARYLSYESFEKLKDLDYETLRAYLLEIQDYSQRTNRINYAELLFYKAGSGFTSANFQRYDFTKMDEPRLRDVHRQLCEEFAKALPDPKYKVDNIEDRSWLLEMVQTIYNENKFATEEFQMGLCEEFLMKVNWLPGGTINKEGGIIPDTVYKMRDQMTEAERNRFQMAELVGDSNIPQRILFSYVKENLRIQYANIGVLPPIKRNKPNSESDSDNKPHPRRSVFIMNIKFRGEDDEKNSSSNTCKEANENNGNNDNSNVHNYIIRVQKWDIGKLLDEDKGLLESINKAENYTDYILNRRLACHLLKMQLPPSLKVRRFIEIYHGKNRNLHGLVIHNAFYERDYVYGYATNRLTKKFFQKRKNGVSFSVSFARMLGKAAAPNLIVGRSTEENQIPIFDDGDEVIQLDENGMPKQIIVTEQPGTFVCYKEPLEKQIKYYADPICNRMEFFQDNFDQVANAYVEGFLSNFRRIQSTAEQYRNTFDNLPDRNPGSMYERWHRVLDRLRDANPDDLAEKLKNAIYEGVNKNA